MSQRSLATFWQTPKNRAKRWLHGRTANIVDTMIKSTGEAATQGVTRTPETVSALLRTLHMDHSSVGQQLPVLQGWLTEHPPSRELRCSLRSNGYGRLLRERPL